LSVYTDIKTARVVAFASGIITNERHCPGGKSQRALGDGERIGSESAIENEIIGYVIFIDDHVLNDLIQQVDVLSIRTFKGVGTGAFVVSNCSNRLLNCYVILKDRIGIVCRVVNYQLCRIGVYQHRPGKRERACTKPDRASSRVGENVHV